MIKITLFLEDTDDNATEIVRQIETAIEMETDLVLADTPTAMERLKVPRYDHP